MTDHDAADADADADDPRAALVRVGKAFHRRGWMDGTAGNLSARLPDGTFWITASGRHKGELTLRDFVRLGPGGAVVERHAPGDRPSAEAAIHVELYRWSAAHAVPIGSILHVHSVEANLAGELAAWNPDGGTAPRRLGLPPLEMLKGLGHPEEHPDVDLDVFDNHADVPRIAADLAARFATRPPDVPAMLIRRHGLTAWGADVAAARNHLELVEFLLRARVMSHTEGIAAWSAAHPAAPPLR